jgi:TsgA-like MFS transporter
MIGRLTGIILNSRFMINKRINKDVYIRLVAAGGILATLGVCNAPTVPIFALSIFVAGIVIGMYYSTSNMILADIYSGPQRAFHIGIINFLYSLGGVSSPFLAGFLLKQGFSWNTPYLIALGIILLILTVTAGARYRDLYASYTPPARTGGKVKIEAPVWMACASIVLYIFAEYSITYWTPIYMQESLGKDPLFAGSVVSAYWIAVLIGRFVQSMLASRIRPRFYIIASGVLSIIAILILRFLTGNTPIMVMAFMAGITTAGIFPALYTFGTEQAEHIKHTAPTLMMLSAGTGSFLAMPAGSAVKSVVGIDYIMYTPAVALLIMCALVLAIRVKNGESH